MKHSEGTKEELGRWKLHITRHDFIGQYIYPMLGAKSSNGVECEATVVQDTGTGRLTLRYYFGDGKTIYAKLYSDELGAHSYRVMKELWDRGFGYDSLYQVPEPLAFLPEHNLVLMRGVGGAPVGAALNGGGSIDLIEGVRQAARWLGFLHRSSIRIGEPEPEWDSLKTFRVCVRLIKAAAAGPEQRSLLLDLMHLLKDKIRNLPEKRPIVQTHGRYHHEHVFISPSAIAVIDLDRSRPSDPAKDSAEFVRVLRLSAFKSGVDMNRAREATSAFLQEYLSQVPEAAQGLPYYWSSFILLSLFGFMKRFRSGDPRWQSLMDFHLREIEQAMEIRI